jgi:hypothetical protein
MLRKTIVIGGGLIALYLVVNYATGSGTVLNSASAGTSTVVRALQGR